MLRKLLKHEFRATARIMLPLYLLVLTASVGARLSIRFGWDHTDNVLIRTLCAMVMTVFAASLVGVCIVSLALMIRRFYQNLLSSEGYIMLTLPASVHKLVWSKLLVSVIWFAATALVTTLSLLILLFDMSFMREIAEGAEFLMRFLDLSPWIGSAAAVFGEAAALGFLSGIVTCLQCYAAMSIGHSFARRKLLLSVAFYFLLQMATQSVLTVITLGPGSVFLLDLANATAGSGTEYFHAVTALSGGTLLLQGIVYYFLTVFTLKRRLNLE